MCQVCVSIVAEFELHPLRIFFLGTFTANVWVIIQHNLNVNWRKIVDVMGMLCNAM